MYWAKYDPRRKEPFSVWQQIKYNAALRLWWIPLKRLALMGFLKTKESRVLSLRDFTPFFWRNLQRKNDDYWLARLRYEIELAKREGMEQGWNSCVEYMQQGLHVITEREKLH